MPSAWTRKGTRVNAIAVGAVRAASLLDDAARYGLDPEAIGMTNASGRLGEPEEIGYGVLFFASDASSFCSGQTLYMHGGPGPAGVEHRCAPQLRVWFGFVQARRSAARHAH